MSINRILSKVSDVKLEDGDFPGPKIYEVGFNHIKDKILRQLKRKAFKLSKDEIELFKESVDRAIKYESLINELEGKERLLDEFRGMVSEGRGVIAAHGRTEKGFRLMAKAIRAPRKTIDWESIHDDFIFLTTPSAVTRKIDKNTFSIPNPKKPISTEKTESRKTGSLKQWNKQALTQ